MNRDGEQDIDVRTGDPKQRCRRTALGLAILAALLGAGSVPSASDGSPPGMPWSVIPVEPSSWSSNPGWSVASARVLGGPGSDEAYDLWPARDGSYLVTGSTQNPSRGDLDLFVLALDRNGDPLWKRVLGGPGLEIGFGVASAPDGIVYAAGWTHSFGAGEGDFYVIGLSAEGTLLFEKTFGGPGEERATHLAVTRDGGVAVVGESYSHGAGDARFYLVKLASNGELEWEKTYDGGSLNERGIAVVEDAEGFLLVGNAMDSRSGSSATVGDGFVVRTDRTGKRLWSRSYGGPGLDILHHAVALVDGGFLLTGYTHRSGVAGESDVWLTAIDDHGDEAWQRTTGGEGADRSVAAKRAPDGRIYVAGAGTRREGFGGWDAQISLLDAAGRTAGEQLVGGPGHDGAVAAYPDGDLGLVVIGYTESFGAGDRNVLFVRMARREAAP